MDWTGRKKTLIKMLKQGKYPELKRLVLRRLYINFIMMPLGFPFTILLFFVLWLLEPFLKVRISVIPTGRIGHLTIEPEFYLRRLQSSKETRDKKIHTTCTPIFVTNRAVQKYKITNQQLFKNYARKMRVFASYFASWVFFSSVWLLDRTRFVFYLEHDENGESDKLLKATKSCIDFTDSEQIKGEAFLKSIGINPKNDWFVCLFSRDSQYLQSTFKNVDWSYHDHRDADINSFDLATQYIIDQGGYVFRIGSSVGKKMNFQHEHFINYAKNYRSDFLDIFLVANCKFVLGTTSGICDVATAMNKPRITTNCVPFGYKMQGKDSLYIPKKVLHKQTGAAYPMSKALKENIDRNFDGILPLDYEYHENTADEILNVTVEMLARVNDEFNYSKEDKKLMERYFDIYLPVQTSSCL